MDHPAILVPDPHLITPQHSSALRDIAHGTSLVSMTYRPGDIDEYRAKYGKAEGEAKFFRDTPIEREITRLGNQFMNGGISCLWESLIGNGTTTASQNLTFFNHANAAVGVGDGGQTALSGTASVTNGSTAITFSVSQTLNVGANGDWIIITGDSTNGVYRVASGSGTSYTLATAYGGSTNASASATKITQILATQTDLQASTNKARQAMDTSFPSHTDGTTSGAASITFQGTFGTSAANFAVYEFGIFNSPTAATGRMFNRGVQSLGTKTSGNTATASISASAA